MRDGSPSLPFLLLVLGIAAALAGWWFDERLPPPVRLLPEMHADPLQASVQAAMYPVRAGEVDYRIQPVADYELWGLVVSRHDADAWWDWIHAATSDHLNVVDLCVVWGANAADGAYRKMKFSSGQFVCYFEGSDASVFTPTNMRAISNNHLLTDEPAVARLLRNVRIGDQIHLRGQLVEYSHDHGMNYHRGTSVTRDDTGNGACETIFVSTADVLRRGDAWPRWLLRAGLLLLVLGMAAWVAAPHRASR